MNQDTRNPAPINRFAVLSMIAALLTVASFCTAVAPIPLTGYVCYPAAAVLGLIALSTGLASLTQIRRSGEDGRIYASIGVWVGGIALIAASCAITMGILLLPRAIASLQQYWK